MRSASDNRMQRDHVPTAMIHQVLVVEDDHQLADWLAEVLVYENCMVDQASNGMEALDLMRSAMYDAIICDIMMPRIDGEAFYSQVAREYPYLAEKFLFITGQATVNAGLSDFATRSGNLMMIKPLKIDDLRLALQELLDR